MSEQFTDRARKALSRAGDEARGLRHSYIGTEHILLALLGENEGAGAVLGSFGVTHQQVRAAIVRMMGMGAEDDAGELSFTGPAEEAIELARREASGRSHAEVETEDILLALLRERSGAAVRILLELDADPDSIRKTLAGAA